MDGRDRLVKRGHFVQPASAKQAAEEMADLGSPVGAFLRERCVTDPACEVLCDDLFKAWTVWCRVNRRDHPGTTQSFGRDLRAAVPGMSIKQHRDNGGVPRRYYNGVGFDTSTVTR
jgi:putative DNA primase/helicase